MTYEPLHHKYRPQTFADLIGQDAISTTLINAIHTGRIAPAYLFTGPRGTGKTSSARILAKSLNCQNSPNPTDTPCGTCEVCRTVTLGNSLDIIEIDAASNTGVDNIRELIEKAQFAPVQCRTKVYIVDECHMLSTAAFNSLLKTLEEPPSHVVFILATTDPQRVLPTIISRCQRFDFRRIPLDAMTNHLKDIAQKENIEIQNEALTLIAQIAQGGLRDAESLLDQLSLLIPPITPEKVWDLVGAVPERDLITLLQAINSQKPEDILTQARNIMNRGREPLILLQNLAGFYRDLLIAKTAPNRNDLVAVTPPTWQEICQLVQNWTLDKIIAGQQHLRQSETQIKNTTQPRLWLELTLLGLLQTPTPPPTYTPQPQPQPQPTYTPQPQPTYTPQPQPTEYKRSDATSQPPTPQPTPTPQPQPTPTPQPIPTNSNLDEVWHRVLAQLDIPKRSLLKDHGCLISLDQNIACITIKNQTLLSMVQPGIPNLEQAFSQIFQQKITIRLSVARASTTTTKEPTPPPENNQPPPQSPPTPQPNPVNTAPPQNQTTSNSAVANNIPSEKPTLETAIQTLIQTFNGREISNPLPKVAAVTTPIQYTTTTDYKPTDLENNFLDDGEDNDETDNNFELDF
ncbi:DNA polymerase III subunit gamma/tau [Ancylothrix sp. C2]|uniref:DNA polymerase III subunit gamma/tau n=1 Tax=Ancylothrix sp. D3o TaxID=2953691 RepID=UPI0021BB84D2|nr:DNA polymerase III subunit gamma/tau [Ancylothrix sp. D3o]MCT7952443.1 DNA polymerase III subunit gamma/tau [Ancylothrix sp. D3o]